MRPRISRCAAVSVSATSNGSLFQVSYHQKGLCKGFVLEWNIGQTNEGKPNNKGLLIDLHLSNKRQEWCIVELLFGLYLFSLVFLLFPFWPSCLSCRGFCWLPFDLRFFLLISVFLFLFFLLLHIHVCQPSAFPPVISLCILHHPFCSFIRPFRFPVWFCILE